MDSRLLSHHGNDFTIFLRLLKKKIITVVMDTEHDVHYQRSAMIELVLPVLHHAGLRSGRCRDAEREDPSARYWLRLLVATVFLLEVHGRRRRVIVECRAISLTRDVPLGLGFIIEPIIKNLPRESLVNTLKATRQALSGAIVSVSCLREDLLRWLRATAFRPGL